MNVRRYLVALWLLAALLAAIAAIYLDLPALFVLVVVLLAGAGYVALMKSGDDR